MACLSGSECHCYHSNANVFDVLASVVYTVAALAEIPSPTSHSFAYPALRHQTDVRELALTKAHCCVASCDDLCLGLKVKVKVKLQHMATQHVRSAPASGEMTLHTSSCR